MKFVSLISSGALKESVLWEVKEMPIGDGCWTRSKVCSSHKEVATLQHYSMPLRSEASVRRQNRVDS